MSTPVNRELFNRTAPKWNCIDYPGEGMHSLASSGVCQWCGKSKSEISQEDKETIEENDNTEKTISLTVTRKEWDVLVMSLMRSESDLESVAKSRKWVGDGHKGYRKFLREDAEKIRKLKEKCIIAWIGRIPSSNT